jgi:hypothetical protein
VDSVSHTPTGSRQVGRRPGAATPAVTRAVGLVASILLVMTVAACGGANAVTTPAAGSASSAPAGSAAADDSAAPAPSGTPWPGNVPDGIIALGALDEQIAAAGKALDDGISAKDLAKTSGAAKGLVDLVDKSMDNVTTVQGYAGTKELGDAYASALGGLRTGAQEIVDGVAKGDAAMVDKGVADLSAGITEYGLARKTLGNFMEQALSMKKMYMK